MKKKNEKVNVELFRWMPLENLLVMRMCPLISQFYLAGTSKVWGFYRNWVILFYALLAASVQ